MTFPGQTLHQAAGSAAPLVAPEGPSSFDALLFRHGVTSKVHLPPLIPHVCLSGYS